MIFSRIFRNRGLKVLGPMILAGAIFNICPVGVSRAEVDDPPALSNQAPGDDLAQIPKKGDQQLHDMDRRNVTIREQKAYDICRQAGAARQAPAPFLPRNHTKYATKFIDSAHPGARVGRTFIQQQTNTGTLPGAVYQQPDGASLQGPPQTGMVGGPAGSGSSPGSDPSSPQGPSGSYAQTPNAP